MFRRPDRLITLVLLTAWCMPAPAQSDTEAGDGEEVIIHADRAVLDRAEGTGVYTGDAELVQGQRRLRAERIEVRLENGEIEEAEARGDPVRIREGEQLNGHAQRVLYKVARDEVHLYDDAFIFHQGRTFEGAELRYQLESRRVEASGTKQERVRMVIPQEDTGRGEKNEP
jgi:lipopolysaccharide export system protein LptA